MQKLTTDIPPNKPIIVHIFFLYIMSIRVYFETLI